VQQPVDSLRMDFFFYFFLKFDDCVKHDLVL
jgi:hypothetical protein